MSIERFVEAQDAVFATVLAELRAGRKRTHWMWFIFPQIKGLGHSEMAQFYAIESPEEAVEYLAHPILGPRLLQCCEIVTGLRGLTAHEVFGSPDDLKFRSCLTLFAVVAKDPGPFLTALDKCYAGQADAATLGLLGEVQKPKLR
jgi:uncharacterized protein (DUF1810 family)